jgi:hypothetical protein
MKESPYLGIHITLIEQWSQFFRRDNWYTFDFMVISTENDCILGGVELTIIILGLGINIRYNHTITKDVDNLKEQIGKINAGKFTGVETEEMLVETAWYIDGESVDKETYQKYRGQM